MKDFHVVAVIGGVALVALGVALALSNPTQDIYEDYATQRLTDYLQQSICPKAPSFFGNTLQNQCGSLVESHQSEIKQLIANGTKRQNYILFSVYKTDLSISTVVPFLPASTLPSYHFETLAAFDKLYTYQAKKQ